MKATINNRRHNHFFALGGMLLLVLTLGCEREDKDLRPATFPNTAEIFVDGFSAGLQYDAFGDSKVTAFTVDENVSFENVIGTSSMRFDVPNEGDPEGGYAGGVFRDLGGRDLTGYDALTFYAQATKSATVNLIGFGNDFLGDKFSATTSLKLSTSWNKYIIPIPDPSKLTMEKGMLVFAEAPEDGEGFSIWMDQVQFEKLGTLAHPRPAIMNGDDVTVNTYIGVTATLVGLTQTMNLPNGADQTVNAAPSYFEFTSSDTTVAKVSELGVVSVLSQGTAEITAKLAGKDAAGSLTIVSQGEFTHAPVPDREAANVISIFSDAYTDVPVDFYNGFFQPFQKTLGGADLEIDGDQIIRYTQLNFVATEFKNPTVDASEMTHFHVDIQIENTIQTGDFFTIELSDFGPDGAFGGGDDATGSVTYNTSPPLVSNEWISLDIPLSDFSGLTQQMNMAQILFKTDGSATDLPGTITDVLVDNMYFYKDGEGAAPIPPTSPAADPTEDAANVISIYSDAYTDVPNQGYNQYGAAAFEEVDLMGNKSLKYAFVAGDNGNFQVIELGGANQIDAAAAGMTNFRFDIWFPKAVGQSSAFLMKVVDIPSSGATEGIINVSPSSTPEMVQGSWLSYDIPISELESSGMGGKSNIQQVVIDLLSSGEVYIDNIYFYRTGGGGGNEPTVAAPTPPARDAADVISLFSNAYTNETVDTFSAEWDDSSVEDVQIAGDDVKKYTFTNFAGIDFSSNKLNATDMTNFHMDIWTPNEVLDKALSIKNVDFGGGSAEASSHILTVTHTATGDVPALAKGSWVSIDVPITAFTGDLTRSDLAQMVLTSGMQTLYVDNIYLYKSGGGANEPTAAAPTPPARDAGNVVSIFSDAYTNITGINLNPGWGQSTVVSEVDIAGSNTLKYANFNYQGTDFSANAQDVSGMQFLHVDMWTTDATDVKVTPINGAGTPAESLQGLTPITAGQWVSYDIPLGDFTASGMTLDQVIQMKFDGQAGTTPSNIWLDNIYFYKTGPGATEPTTAAPTPPARDAADVVSIFSDSYTNITGINLNPGWGQSTVVSEVDIAGSNTLKYANFNYQGTDFSANAQNVSGMQFLHVDMWTADATDVKVTPINGAGSPAESLQGLTPITAGQWVSYDIPLGDFTASGMSLDQVIQMKLDGQAGTTPSNIWLDNIYFYKSSGGSGGGPSEAAPTPPARDAANVVSIYSDAYANIATDNFDAGWCGSPAVTEVAVVGNSTLKKSEGIDCHGIDFSTNRQDLSSFTHIHFDIYTNDTDLVGDVFNVKLVDFAGGSGEASALEVNINTGTVPAIEAGVWVSVDIDITSLGGVVVGNLTRSDIAQIGITTANLTNVWYDNIYLYK